MGAPSVKQACLFTISCLLWVALVGCEEEEPINQIIPPRLLVSSSLNFGESPVGIPQRGRLVLSNAGQARLEISQIHLDPNDDIFEVGADEMPLGVTASGGKDIVVHFMPLAQTDYRTDLTFVTNQPDGDTASVLLMGQGKTNISCHPCNDPPIPECHLENDGMVFYYPTTETDCENEDGYCAYKMVYVPCEHGPCEPETGLCPNTPLPGQPAVDAGQPAVGAGQPMADAGTPLAHGGETCLNAPYLVGNLGMVLGHYGNTDNYQTPWVTDNFLSGCTEHSTSDGKEKVYAIDLPAQKTLTVTVSVECEHCSNDEHLDEVIYLLNTCPADGVTFNTELENCVAGAQENFGIYPTDLFETMGYENNTHSPQTLYVVVDAWCNGSVNYCPDSDDPFTLEWQIQ